MMIFAFVFLGAFVAIIGLTPAELVSAGKDYSAFGENIPDVWNGIDLLAYNFTGVTTIQLNATDYAFYDFSLGNRNLRLYTYNNIYTSVRYLLLSHRYGAFLAWEESLDWYNRNQQLVSWHTASGAAAIGENELNADYAAFENIEFIPTCLGLGGGSSYFKLTALFQFNTTTYTTPEEAWNSSELYLLFGITLSDSNTAMNAWYLITQLLTFNTVEIFGTATPEAVALNLLMALPFFASIGFIATAIILEILPF
jgi:hypothetical protein